MAKSTKPPAKTTKFDPVKTPVKKEYFLVELIGRFGITGTAIFVLLWTFWTVITVDQKRQMFDKFVLLKFTASDNVFFAYILILLTFFVAGMRWHYKRRLELKDDRIRTLESEVLKLEEKLLK